jgi:hypothetical protein
MSRDRCARCPELRHPLGHRSIPEFVQVRGLRLSHQRPLPTHPRVHVLVNRQGDRCDGVTKTLGDHLHRYAVRQQQSRVSLSQVVQAYGRQIVRSHYLDPDLDHRDATTEPVTVSSRQAMVRSGARAPVPIPRTAPTPQLSTLASQEAAPRNGSGASTGRWGSPPAARPDPSSGAAASRARSQLNRGQHVVLLAVAVRGVDHHPKRHTGRGDGPPA